LPKRLSPMAEPVEFVSATLWRVTGLVKDPAYAGTYAQ
jgi:hypothetical protein